MTMASAGQWVKFFNTAGIPSQSAATYAHIFVENRIQTDMLMDLNKEYLREMGVTIMGDIIAILRHAKEVSEQNAREKVLCSEIKVPVAAVPAQTNTKKMISTKAPISAINSEIVSNASMTERKGLTNVVATRPQPRRVLPEHEGLYKITLSTGKTPRSREILTKKAMLYSDKESIKPDVFDRLASNSSSTKDPSTFEHAIQVMKLNKHYSAAASSIFARLGDREAQDIASTKMKAISVSGILKTSATKKVTGVVKKSLKLPQKVIVKRIPAKAITMVANEYDPPERMETGEKSVSFSSEDEIVEIASRRVIVNPRATKKFPNVKARLGENAINNIDAQHRTRKMVKFKPTSVKKDQITALRMKSDELLLKNVTPVHNRLGSTRSTPLPTVLVTRSKGKTANSMTLLTNRIGRVSLSKRSFKEKLASESSPTSVFDRLGYGSKY